MELHPADMLPKQTKGKAGGAAADGVSKGSEESSGQHLTEKLNIDISGSFYFLLEKMGKMLGWEKIMFLRFSADTVGMR